MENLERRFMQKRSCTLQVSLCPPLESQKRSLGMSWLVGRRGKQQLVGKLCFGRVLDGYSQSTGRVQSLSENAHPPFLLCLQSYGHSQTHSQHPKTISTSNQCIITTQNTEFSNLFGQNNTEMHQMQGTVTAKKMCTHRFFLFLLLFLFLFCS